MISIKGAIIGDIIGSIYEFNNYQGNINDFSLFTPYNFFTDDTVTTLAICKAQLEKKEPNEVDYAKNLWTFCRKYPDLSYGGRFNKWLQQNPPRPYHSFGNGAAMRISSIPYFYKNNLDKAIKQALCATRISHNHEESYKAVSSLIEIIWGLNNGKKSIYDIKDCAQDYYGELPPITRIEFNESCQGTMPICYSIILNSNSFEEAMRIAVGVGGDTDTICAIVGSMAEPLFGIPKEIESKMWDYLDDDMGEIIEKFEEEVRC